MVPKFLFDFLTTSRKYKLLWERGMLIGTRHDNGRKIHLYLIDEFYAEVAYKYGTDDDIRWVKTYSNFDKQKLSAYKDNKVNILNG